MFNDREAHFAFTVINTSLDNIVKVLWEFLEQRAHTPGSVCRDVEKSFKWQSKVTAFVDFIPLLIQMEVREESSKLAVKVIDLSSNDIIRFARLCKDALTFVKQKGLEITLGHHPAYKFNLLDDDFECMELEGVLPIEAKCWRERVEDVISDVDSCRYDVRVEALRTMARWSTSSKCSHAALANVLAERASRISALLQTADTIEKLLIVTTLQTLVQGSASIQYQLDAYRSCLATVLSQATIDCDASCEQTELLQLDGTIQGYANSPMDNSQVNTINDPKLCSIL